ncbi:MAG: hypothetical protein ACTSRA_12035 [Promethearchaeota archaeon]
MNRYRSFNFRRASYPFFLKSLKSWTNQENLAYLLINLKFLESITLIFQIRVSEPIRNLKTTLNGDVDVKARSPTKFPEL